MRVLFLASYFPRPTKPLTGTWALEQAKAFANACDLRVVVATPWVPSVLRVIPRARPWVDVPQKHRWDNVEIDYLKIFNYPVRPFKQWAHKAPQRQMDLAWGSILRRLYKIVDEFSPDAIYCHHTAVSAYFAMKLKATRGLPYIITDHDFAEIRDCSVFPRRRAFCEPIKNAALANICVASRMELDTRAIFPKANAVTIYNGISPHPPAILQTPRPPEWRDRQIIFSAGMFIERKGFHILIEAFSRIAADFPNAVLRIAGDGTYRPEIQATIDRLNLGEKVTLLGLQPPRQVVQEMAWSDLFALVSWDEPFATVFVEAMGAGKPIITCNDGGITDVVHDGVEGLWVSPKDIDSAAAALRRLLANPAQRRTMGAAAKRLVDERLNWAHNVQEILALFEQALAPGAVPVH